MTDNEINSGGDYLSGIGGTDPTKEVVATKSDKAVEKIAKVDEKTTEKSTNATKKKETKAERKKREKQEKKDAAKKKNNQTGNEQKDAVKTGEDRTKESEKQLSPEEKKKVDDANAQELTNSKKVQTTDIKTAKEVEAQNQKETALDANNSVMLNKRNTTPINSYDVVASYRAKIESYVDGENGREKLLNFHTDKIQLDTPTNAEGNPTKPGSDGGGFINHYGVNFSAFDGGKKYESALEELFNWRYEISQDGSSLGTKNELYAPWDFRFNEAYTYSTSIGNSMPGGESMVGMPSLLNPNALIRFDHIAGQFQNKMALDQRNSEGMRFGAPTVRDFVIPEGLTADEQKQLVANRLNDKANSTTREDIQINDDGTVNYTENDPNKKIYKNKNGEEIVYDLTVDGPDDPTTRKYWIRKQGLVECDSNGSAVWVTQDLCEDGKVKIPPASEPEKQKALLDSLSDVEQKKLKAQIDYQANKGWTDTGRTVTERKVLTEEAPIYGAGSIITKEPTIEELCNPDNWKGKEQFLYSYSDFLYCSYMKIPNNHLITLRRFPMPVYDNGRIFNQDKNGKFMLPAAKAVTWIGETTGNKVSEITKFSTSMNWEEITADMQKVDQESTGMDPSNVLGDGKMGGMFKKLMDVNAVATKNGDFSRMSGYDAQRAKFDPYDGGAYKNKVEGPVNVIYKTYGRKRGLEFSEEGLSINFHYSLKSIGGINPKAALLDIMANMLALTSNNAAFWGGAIKMFPHISQYPFPGGEKGMNSWYNGNVTGFLDSVVGQFLDTLGDIGTSLLEMFQDPVGAIKKLASGGSRLFMAKKQAGSRPEIMKLGALLTGDPVGEWHLVIGNPFNPIRMIGNLIMTGAEFSFNDELGADDFPTQMIVRVNLKHGKPRDKGDIESMYNRGTGRLHYGYFGNEEPWNLASSTKNSNIDRPATKKDMIVNGGFKNTAYVPDEKMIKGYQSQDVLSNVKSNATRIYGFGADKAARLARKMSIHSGHPTT